MDPSTTNGELKEPVRDRVGAPILPGGLREMHWHANTDEWLENTGDDPLRFLAMFRSDRFAHVSLAQWMALTPPELVQPHLNLNAATMAVIGQSREKPIIV
jgi:oxalate decarboxylase